MRPYLAILKDSFREALASRVLLIALAAIVVVLLLLSPFGLNYEKATELRRSEVRNPERLLREFLESDDNAAAVHLRSLLTEEQLKRADQLLNPQPGQPAPRQRGPVNPLQRDLVNQLNRLTNHPEFFNSEAWSDTELSEEAEELIADKSLGAKETKRRNLLLLIAAFPRSIRVTDSQAISLTYANAEVIESIPLTPTQFEPIFDRILTEVITVFLGFFGVFASLLVTAGLIPRTFEPGEIALLLSKPVNRSALFITKFLGGCTFTLLYSAVMVTGIWLLLGIRMGFWRPELMWCIPVYVFLFMIYFSISAVAGAIWRNSIVALSLVVVFWLGITVIEVSKTSMEEYLMDANGLQEIIIAGDDLITVDGNQRTKIWNASEQRWSEIYRQAPGSGLGGFARRMLGDIRFQPVYDRKADRLLALQQSPSRFRGLGAPQLMAGYEEDDWERVQLGRLSDACVGIFFSSNGAVLLPTVSGVYEYVDPEEGGTDQGGGGLFNAIAGGLLGGGSKEFRRLKAPDYPDLDDNYACAVDTASNNLFVLSVGKLTAMKRNGDAYEKTAERDFETEEPGVLAASGSRVIVALGDGRVQLLDVETLETTCELTLSDGVLPKTCAASPTGNSIAVLTHEDTIMLFDPEHDRQFKWTPPENGSCSAVTYSEDGHLLVSDGRLAVRKYDLASRERVEEWAESESWVYDLFDFGMKPLHTILPKPSQLDDFVPYVMTGEKSILPGERDGPPIANRGSLQRDRKVFNAWQVIRDNAAFVIVVLLFGCFIIARRDF